MIPFHLFKYHKQLNCEFVVKDYVTQFTKKTEPSRKDLLKTAFPPEVLVSQCVPGLYPRPPLIIMKPFIT